MANLTAPRDDSRQTGDLVEVDAGTNKIFHGAAVTIASNGYAHAGAPKEPFVGVAQESVTGGLVRVYTEGVASFNCASAVGVQANVGKNVALVDDNTVGLATGNDAVVIGIITKIESTTSVRVKLR
ncbi:MAG: hypothetical protein D8G53_06930 [Candidatus Saccharimonas sp.]|nr:MAG: hypothetical protein D8G53_06930 [Candidatus Saccharimonas sp.]